MSPHRPTELDLNFTRLSAEQDSPSRFRSPLKPKSSKRVPLAQPDPRLLCTPHTLIRQRQNSSSSGKLRQITAFGNSAATKEPLRVHSLTGPLDSSYRSLKRERSFFQSPETDLSKEAPLRFPKPTFGAKCVSPAKLQALTREGLTVRVKTTDASALLEDTQENVNTNTGKKFFLGTATPEHRPTSHDRK